MLHLVEHSAVQGLETPLLGRGQLGGDLECREVGERTPYAVQFGLELRGSGRQCRAGHLVASQMLERGAHQLLPIGRVGHAPGPDEHQRLTCIQAVFSDALEQRVLLIVRQHCQRMRQSRPDCARGNVLLDRRRNARADRPAPGNPIGFAPEKTRHLRRCQAVVLDERADHARLIQRCRRARWRVDGEQQPLVLDCLCWRFEHDRNGRVALLAPPLQALEAIQDLECRARSHAGTRRHAQRKLGTLIRSCRHGPRTQRAVARAQAFYRYEAHVCGNVLTPRRVGVGGHLHSPAMCQSAQNGSCSPKSSASNEWFVSARGQLRRYQQISSLNSVHRSTMSCASRTLRGGTRPS